MDRIMITVLKKLVVEDIHADYAGESIPLECARNNVGDIYISEDGKMPDKFCPGAWGGLAGKVEMLASGQESPYTRMDGVAVHCCNDGLHPVIFKLERI
jgi:uncharacterized repeat protein (TIGR04076 family)